MNYWKFVDSAPVPGSCSELRLFQRDQEFSIQVDGAELMNSSVTASEHMFSELGCARIAGRSNARVLIGGLGMGFSLKSALDRLPPDATVVVAELVPQVAAWNRGELGHLAGHPLRDPRVSLREIDVGLLLRRAHHAFDLIMLDVDNGPGELTRVSNHWIYSQAGILAARSALRPGGVLGIWSFAPAEDFVQRLEAAGFEVEQTELPAAVGCYGVCHTVWFAHPIRLAQSEAATAEPRVT